MKRRAVLAAVGGLAASGLAGCVSDDDPGAGTDGEVQSPDGSERGTSVGTTPGTGATDPGSERTAPPPARRVSLVGATIEPLDGGCGQQRDEAGVQFEGDGRTVSVSGTIWGANTCKVPALADTAYDAQRDELTVAVATTDRERDGTPACGQCIVELDYRVTASFEGGLPGSVTVRHDHGDGGAVVARERRA